MNSWGGCSVKTFLHLNYSPRSSEGIRTNSERGGGRMGETVCHWLSAGRLCFGGRRFPPLRGRPSPISESQLLEGDPGRCRAQISSRKSPYGYKLRAGALAQVGRGWLQGLY